jgi:hypothetical protein
MPSLERRDLFPPFLYRKSNDRGKGNVLLLGAFLCFLVHDSAIGKVGMLITDSGAGHTGCISVGYNVCRKCVNNSYGSKFFLGGVWGLCPRVAVGWVQYRSLNMLSRKCLWIIFEHNSNLQICLIATLASSDSELVEKP